MINLELIAIVVLLAVVVYLLTKKSKQCKCNPKGTIMGKPPKDTPPPIGGDPVKP